MKISEIKEYLVSIKPYITFSCYTFLVSAILGYIFAQNNPNEITKFLEEIKSLFPIDEESTPFQIFLFIFENNVSKIFLLLPLGIFAGIFPLLFIFTNGLVFGIFAQVSSSLISWKFFVLGIAPHGIIEIPVLIIATAISLKIGKVAVWKIFKKDKKFLSEFSKAIKFYIFVLLPLLFIAALIEAYITPIFISLSL
ncbi:MAG: stage II sporulation protein M [Candidatus Pacebacteria bacterium]|nr:stage II sporulation protein M [Candidatus Paceibacterota bacterium]